jgi:hypothetical protein
METVKNFVDKNLANPPNVNDLDQIFEISNQFNQIISNLSDEDKKEFNNYLTDIYNTNIEKVKNCDTSRGGKKSRRRKHKKRNTLKRGVKRGGDESLLGLSGTAQVLGIFVLVLLFLNAVNRPEPQYR